MLAAAIGTAVAATQWWLYFDVVFHVATRRLGDSEAGERDGRDSYSYLHFPMIATIAILAAAHVVLIFEETRSYGESRKRVRHGVSHEEAP